ncbi:MAG: hypothetical protein JNL97_00395 [Verrucomicrobiales bacterium]|nr:hypothetical protein [Verrucomicrobiales bacterium]
MKNLLPIWLLLLAFLVRSLAMPQAIADGGSSDVVTPTASLRDTPCRCCDCRGVACCAPAPRESRPTTPQPATPVRGCPSDTGLLLPPSPSGSTPAWPDSDARAECPASAAKSPPPLPAPSFLLWGGFLI